MATKKATAKKVKAPAKAKVKAPAKAKVKAPAAPKAKVPAGLKASLNRSKPMRDLKEIATNTGKVRLTMLYTEKSISKLRAVCQKNGIAYTSKMRKIIDDYVAKLA